jgi:uncharacterized damage-inducible protein DinB
MEIGNRQAEQGDKIKSANFIGPITPIEAILGYHDAKCKNSTRHKMDHYRMFAAYNAWVNALLYEAAADLTDEERDRDTGAFFRSLSGTLNHLVTADRVWLHRFTGQGPQPTSLDARAADTFADLWAARRTEDARITAFAEGLTPEALAATFHYSPITKPEPVSHKLGPAVAHFFNHQTHHRGQAHMCLTVLGRPSLSLDMIYFLRSAAPVYL